MLLRDKVRHAAEDGMKMYDKHVTPAMEVCKYRFVYNPVNKPPALPSLPASVAGSMALLKPFLGFDGGSSAFDVMTEYEAYRSSWAPLADGPPPCPAQFWADKAAVWPTLSKIAGWWVEVPTSSVAVERMFGIMRAIAQPLRASMGEEAFEAEWLFRVNRDIVEGRLAAALRRCGAA